MVSQAVHVDGQLFNVHLEAGNNCRQLCEHYFVGIHARPTSRDLPLHEGNVRASSLVPGSRSLGLKVMDLRAPPYWARLVELFSATTRSTESYGAASRSDCLVS